MIEGAREALLKLSEKYELVIITGRMEVSGFIKLLQLAIVEGDDGILVEQQSTGCTNQEIHLCQRRIL